MTLYDMTRVPCHRNTRQAGARSSRRFCDFVSQDTYHRSLAILSYHVVGLRLFKQQSDFEIHDKRMQHPHTCVGACELLRNSAMQFLGVTSTCCTWRTGFRDHKVNRTISDVTLFSNQIGDEGAKALANSLKATLVTWSLVVVHAVMRITERVILDVR